MNTDYLINIKEHIKLIDGVELKELALRHSVGQIIYALYKLGGEQALNEMRNIADFSRNIERSIVDKLRRDKSVKEILECL